MQNQPPYGGPGPAGQNPYTPPTAAGAGTAMGAPVAVGGNYSPAPSVAFKFAFIQDGNAQVFGKQGEVNPHYLVLNNFPISMGQIIDTDTRDNSVIVQVSHGYTLAHELHTLLQDEQFIAIQARNMKGRELELAIDRHASRYAAEVRRAALQAEGRADALALLECPLCRSVLDLSDMTPSQYVFCRFCTSIFQPGAIRAEADEYRNCDECGLFGRNLSYTEFYFYFLLIVYGFSSNKRHMCDNCAGGLFWKMLLINFIFVLGVPAAIWVKIKSSSGRDPELARLPEANKLAGNGRAQEAQAIYQQMHQHYPDHPGLLFNEAHGHINANDVPSAVHCLQRALQGCSTYRPAHVLLEEVQTLLGAAPQGHGPQGYPPAG